MAQLAPENKVALLRQHDDGVPWPRIAACTCGPPVVPEVATERHLLWWGSVIPRSEAAASIW